MKEKKERVFPTKPEWKIILDHLVYQDNSILYKLCRKMIIHLERMKIPEIYFLIEELNPTLTEDSHTQAVGPNWPKPKGNPLIPREIIKKVFDIADKYVPDDELTQQITQWLHKEKLSNLSRVLEKRQAPLVDVIEALKTYFQHGGSKEFTSVDERVGVRVAIIYRFLSENLRYINIAKHYITLMAIEKIFERFYQGSTTNITSGVGIGLSYIKILIETLNGKINVESKLNEGSTFKVILPITQNAQKTTTINLPVATVSKTPITLGEEVLLTATTNKPLLLIIEDNQDIEDNIHNNIS